GEYLKRIVFVIAEIPLEAEYEGAYTEAELDAFMESNGFEVVEGDDKNKVYGNAGFKDMWKTVDPATIKE
ncbi:MAG TPA: hypothetical protein VHC46_10490, partial [Thermodesulfobacteriota bacterium]|nr:hypothetical protein [Thermodesulfobacteriota bacterium]